jgi:SAM-dependent methyltransferase
MIHRIRELYATQGVTGAAWVLARRLLGGRARCWHSVAPLFPGRRGLEIGGPSQLFRPGGLLPVYPVLASLDGVNFSTETVWEGKLREGDPYRFDGDRAGRQYIREITDLRGIPDRAYDLVLNSHVIEHTANPLKAMAEIARVIDPAGVLLMVVPHRDGTGDRFRPVTTLEHMIEDFRRDAKEDEWGPENTAIRTAHYHVFDSLLVARLLNHCGFQIVALEAARPFNIVAVARPSLSPDNSRWLDPSGPHLRSSPFRTDQDAAGLS